MPDRFGGLPRPYVHRVDGLETGLAEGCPIHRIIRRFVRRPWCLLTGPHSALMIAIMESPDEQGMGVLHPLNMFTPSGATVEILGDLDALVREIDSYRPLDPDLSRQLMDDLLYDRIYSSAVTEGNRLSRRETIAVLSSGLIEAGSRKDTTEIRNLGEAILQLEELVSSDAPLSEGLVRELHALVLRDLDPQRRGGSFRTEQVAIAGSKSPPPAAGDVAELVRTLVTVVNSNLESVHPVVLAGWAHWGVTRIHPFTDGNGRVARLVQDFVLLRRQYLTAPLFSEDRERQYYEALEAADLGDAQPFMQLLAKNILRVGDRYLSAIRENDEKQRFVSSFTKAITEKVRDTEYRRFVRWDRHMKRLKFEVQELVEELSESVPGLLTFRDYQGVDFDKYRALRAGERAERTWMIGLQFRHEHTQLRFVFWVGRHFRRPHDPFPEMTDEPTVIVSMEDQDKTREEGHTFYSTLDDLGEAMISLREVVVHDGSLARRRNDPIEDHDEWDFDVSPGTIARDFLTEVMQRLL